MGYSLFYREFIADDILARAGLKLILSATNPDTTITEPNTSHGYAQMPLAGIIAKVVDGSEVRLQNTAGIVFGPAHTAPWITVNYFAILDEDDNILVSAPLSAAKATPIGDTASWGIGALRVKLR